MGGVEGIGKSSFGANAPKPVFLMSRGETGLETLIDSGQVNETPHSPEIMTWNGVMDFIDLLTTSEHDYKTLVIDTLNGLERLCHEHTCATMYGNDWGKKGFSNYQQGPDSALVFWREMLSKLDTLREVRKMAIIGLQHTKVKNFKNPDGPDYDRYTADMHEKTWGLTLKWADIVLFANFFTVIDDDGPRAKGTGGKKRFIYTERTAAYDAKNRHGLPGQIDMGNSGAEAWGNFIKALKEGKGE